MLGGDLRMGDIVATLECRSRVCVCVFVGLVRLVYLRVCVCVCVRFVQYLNARI